MGDTCSCDCCTYNAQDEKHWSQMAKAQPKYDTDSEAEDTTGENSDTDSEIDFGADEDDEKIKKPSMDLNNTSSAGSASNSSYYGQYGRASQTTTPRASHLLSIGGYTPGMTRIMSISIGDLVVETATPLDPVTMLPLEFVSDKDPNEVPVATEEQMDAYATPVAGLNSDIVGLAGLSFEFNKQKAEEIQNLAKNSKNAKKNGKNDSKNGGSTRARAGAESSDANSTPSIPPTINLQGLNNLSTVSGSLSPTLSPSNQTQNVVTFGGISDISAKSAARDAIRLLKDSKSNFAYSTRDVGKLRVFQFRRIAQVMQNGHNYNFGIGSDSLTAKPSHLEDNEFNKNRILPLSIKDRTHGKLLSKKVYKSCFVASEMVAWLLRYKYVKTIEDAIKFGNNMMDKRVIECVMTTNKHGNKKFTMKNCYKLNKSTTNTDKSKKKRHKTEEKAYFRFIIENPLPPVADLPGIVKTLRTNLKLGTAKEKKYKECFVSDDCIEFMINNFIALNEYNAISIGQLIVDNGYFEQVTNKNNQKKQFVKGKYYRFLGIKKKSKKNRKK